MTACTREVNPQRLVSVKEALRYGKWSRTKLYRLINAGAIVAVKDVAQTLIDLDSVDEYKKALPRLGASQ
jgi:excisionase family DNA binding protein